MEVAPADERQFFRSLWQLGAAIIISAIVLFLAVFIGANSYDYYRYRRAIKTATSLSANELRELSQNFKLIETASNEFTRYDRQNIPKPFKHLRPQSVSLHDHTGGITLYNSGTTYVSLHIDNGTRIPTIAFQAVAGGQIIGKTLWANDPVWLEMLHPQKRIVTVSEFRYRKASVHWIVLKNEIRVIERANDRETDDKILTRIPLPSEGLQKIQTAITHVPANIRGRRYSGGTSHEDISLRVIFSPDGTSRRDDIELSDTWCQDVGPLLNAVSSFLEKDHRIEFESAAKTANARSPLPQFVATWDEIRDFGFTFLPYPWWCSWHRWVPSLETI